MPNSRGLPVRSYIVRVYQSHPQNAVRLDGLVEVVETGAKLSFHDRDELWSILLATESGAAAKPARPTTDRKRPAGRKP